MSGTRARALHHLLPPPLRTIRETGSVDVEEVRMYLAGKVQQARVGGFGPYDYAYWAREIEFVWPVLEEFMEYESIQEMLHLLYTAIRKQRNGIFAGADAPARDSDLVAVRTALRVPREHVWLWPELIEGDE